jgi:hypothetical protein
MVIELADSRLQTSEVQVQRKALVGAFFIEYKPCYASCASLTWKWLLLVEEKVKDREKISTWLTIIALWSGDCFNCDRPHADTLTKTAYVPNY